MLQDIAQVGGCWVMANEWPRYRLADLCESIDYGYTASAQITPVGPKFLRITDIRQASLDWDSVPYVEIDEEKKKQYVLKSGDIVVARTGAFTGHNAYIKNPPDAIFASYLIRLRAKPGVVSRFLYYFMQSPVYTDYIQAAIGGSAQPNANAKVLTGIDLSLPPLPEQRAIAHILGTLDDKIELNRKMSQTLEAMAQAIFKSWFVDFDPVIDNALKAGKPIPDSLAKRAAKRKQVLEKVRQNHYPPLPK
ncbi:hypothetical protein DRN98_07475, partial [Methanosarcinales archaeon]